MDKEPLTDRQKLEIIHKTIEDFSSYMSTEDAFHIIFTMAANMITFFSANPTIMLNKFYRDTLK
jgi:hypothetical protein